MANATPEEIAAAERLKLSLDFGDSPKTIAALVMIVDELMRRVEALERRRR